MDGMGRKQAQSSMVTTLWAYSLLGPGEVIMGTGEGQVPLFLSRPAIPLLCFTFHLLVLVSGTRLVLFPLVQTSSHTDTSISNTHVYVGQVETAGVNNNAGWALNPFCRCPAHSTSWQAGCAVCDRALSFPPIPTADVPEPLATSVRSIKRESTESTRSVELDLVEHEVAQHVGHQKSEPLTPISVDQLSLANLMVSRLRS